MMLTFFCKISMLLLSALHLLTPFVPVDLSLATFVVTCAALVLSMPLMGKGFKKITIVFLVLGSGLLLFFGQPFSVWMTAFASMTSLISILIVMQLFSIPIKLGNYQLVMRYWLSKSFKSEKSLFLFSTVVTHLLASILSFGVIPVMISLFGDTLKGKIHHYERFISVAISRGFGLVVLWAPGAINVMLVIHATGIKWSDLFLPSMIFSVIGIATSYFVETRFSLSNKADFAGAFAGEVGITKSAARTKAGQVIAVVLGLLLFIMFLEKMSFGSSPANRIMVAGAIVVLLWIAVFVRQSDFKTILHGYWNKEFLKIVDLAPLFISMGIFSTAIQQSGVLALIQPHLQVAVNAMGISALAVLPVLMIVCALAGIHPFISIVVFGQILSSLQMPVPPISIALCLALGGAISYIVSPFAGMILTLSKFLNCRTVDISIKWNGVFSSVLFVEGIVFAYFWGRFCG